MKKNSPYLVLIFSLLFFTDYGLHAQVSTELIPHREGKLWGFADKSGKIIVRPTFDKVSFFGYNYETYSMEEFDQIPEAEYQIVTHNNNLNRFSNPIAFVKKGRSIGIINIKGEVILSPIPADFIQLDNKGNGIYEVYGFKVTDGNEGMENVNCAYLHDNGLKCTPLIYTTCTECEYDNYSESDNFSGFYNTNLKYTIVSLNKKQHLLNSSGTIEGSYSFDEIKMFENDWFIGTNHYKDQIGNSKSKSLLWNVKTGMKEDLGNAVSVRSGGSGYFNIIKNDSLFILGVSGARKYIKDVDFISNYTKDGIAVFSKSEGVLKMINNKGLIVYNNKIDKPFNSIVYKNEKYWMSENGSKYAEFDIKTKQIINYYDEIPVRIKLLDKEYFQVKKNNKFGLQDLSGKTILENNFDSPFEVFDSLKKYIKISKNGKYGLLNNNLTEVLAFEFDQIGTYDTEFVKIDKNGKTGILSKGDFKIIVPLEMLSISSAPSEEGPIVFIGYNGKENTYYNLDGSRYYLKDDIVEPIYDYLNNIFYEYEKVGTKTYLKMQNGEVHKKLFGEDRRSYLTMFSNNLRNKYFVLFHNLDSIKAPWIDRSNDVSLDTGLSTISNVSCNQYFPYNVNVIAEIYDSNYVKIATAKDYFVSLFGDYILANREDGYKLIDFKNEMKELPYNFRRFEIDYINKEMFLYKDENSNISYVFNYREGKEIKKPESFYKYTYVYPAVGNRFVANNCRYGLVGKDDKELIPPIYKNMKTAGNGNFIVRDDSLNVGIINSINQYITPPIYKTIYLFGNNFIGFKHNNDKSIVLINGDGSINTTISSKDIWHALADPFESIESIERRSNNGKCIFIQIEKDEWFAIKNDFSTCDKFFTYNGGYDNYRYLISPNFNFGENVFNPCLEQKLHIEKLKGGGTIILDNLKHKIHGVINKDGKWTIPLIKNDYEYFIIKEGLWINCFKYSNNTHSYLGPDGNFITAISGKDVIYLNNVNLFCVKDENSIYGFIGSDGTKYFSE